MFGIFKKSGKADELRTQMAQQARAILDKNHTADLIPGGEPVVQETISALINLYPGEKKKHSNDPSYGFADMVQEYSDRLTDAVIGPGWRIKRGMTRYDI